MKPIAYLVALFCLLLSWAMLFLGDPLITAGHAFLGSMANLTGMIGGIFVFPFAFVWRHVRRGKEEAFLYYFVANMILVPLPLWMGLVPSSLIWL